jgi:hypothetical protein
MIKILIAKTFRQKLIGLIGKSHINYGLFFPNVNSIHTYFMKEPIDVIGLNAQMIVSEIYPFIKPNHILFLKKSKHTLELPKGYSRKYKIGDKIKLST